jgi:acetylornithine deacetylase/succinyl-diaminopimelate desuccinylase-like protein
MRGKFVAIASLAAGLVTPVLAQPSQDTAARALVREILTEAVAVRTVAGGGQTPQLAAMLAARFRAAGFADRDIQIVDAVKGKEPLAGLLVRFRGKNAKRRPVLLLGHTDVVDAPREAWATDPFMPVEQDGYLIGRGSLDNKASVSVLATTLIDLKRSGWQPARDIVLVLSGDEESGMVTTRALVAHPWVSRAEFALNGDAGLGVRIRDDAPPTFSVQSAEKTVVTFELTAKNAGGHSSMPRGDNAIYDVANAIKAVQGLRFPVRFNPISEIMARNTVAERGREVGAALTRLLADPADQEAIGLVANYPDVSSFLQTTCVPTLLSGGSVANALAQRASVTVNCRLLPGTPVAEVEQALRTAVANPTIAITQQGDAVESPASPATEALLQSITRAIHIEYPGAPVQMMMSAGGTDGREYRRLGIPTYGAGSIVLSPQDFRRVHGTDERVSLDALYRDLTFWDAMLRDVGR